MTRARKIRIWTLILLLAVLMSGKSASVNAAQKMITLNSSKLVLFAGLSGRNTFRLETKLDPSLKGRRVRYVSDDPQIAAVNQGGLVRGRHAGKTKITVTVGKEKAYCTVYVRTPVLKLISDSTVTLKTGETTRIHVRYAPTDAGITFKSFDTKVAAVSRYGVITAKGAGTTKVKAYSHGKSVTVKVTVPQEKVEVSEVKWKKWWKYASYSKIHSSSVKLYKAVDSNHIVVAVNAGHGTSGGSNVFTLCHPDGTPKVTGGSTAAGAVYATAVAYGTVFLDGTPEAAATLSLARILKDELLAAGFDVLMIREGNDVRLDNIARTVFANHCADCHIALHYDSTDNDKGAYYVGIPNVASYRAMEPVASTWKKSTAFGESLISGLRSAGVRIYGNGNLPTDLTQTSYSTIPSIDIEVGDRGSDHGARKQTQIAKGLTEGVKRYFNKQ